jgi:hypothetical protein
MLLSTLSLHVSDAENLIAGLQKVAGFGAVL